MMTATEALQRLQEGNARFVAGDIDPAMLHYHAKREALREGQQPFAIVLGCSDSRVPVEIVFDQGLGDLFVIRVAGNIVAQSQIGSIEFAAMSFGARLVVVLGHTRCGAVDTTLRALQTAAEPQSENLRFIVDKIRPSVEQAIADGNGGDVEALAAAVGRDNVRRSAEAIRNSSGIIAQLVAEDGLAVVCAEYSLHSGKVDFF